MTKTKRKGQPEFPRGFNIGDLVNLDGYTGVLYRVDSYTENREVYSEETYMYVEYLLINVDNENEWDVGYDEDITLVAPAAEAAKYLRNRKARERRRGRGKQTVDSLLDEYNDKMALFQLFGDAKYERAAKRAMAKLSKLTKEGA
jgi:hypothetical protein